MKEKLFLKFPPVFTEAHQRFQEHYWLYGSATLAGVAAGMLVVGKLVKQPSAIEVQEKIEYTPFEEEVPQEIAA